VVATNKYLDEGSKGSKRMTFFNDTLCFLKSGANVNAVFDADLKSSSNSESTALGLAVKKEYTQAKPLIDLLLKEGANPNIKFGERKLTAIHLAAENGNYQALNRLLDSSPVDIRDSSDRTPIIYAVHGLLKVPTIKIENISETISLLKNKGHDINAVDSNNSTALFNLCVLSRQSPNVALTLGRHLLALGADVNRGESPLFALMITNEKPFHEDIEDLAIDLVRKGADLSVCDKNNKSILTLAKEAKAERLVKEVEDQLEQLENQANLLRTEGKRIVI